MASKKTVTKTIASAPKKAEVSPKPAAKKATKKAAAKKAPAKKAAAVPAKAPAKKATSATAAKAPVKKAAKKAAVTKSPAPVTTKKVSSKPSLDAIARAAYMNYRRRVEQGTPGDSQGDWLEAERQFASRR